MRRFFLILMAGTLWLFLLAVPALADNGPHVAGQYVGTTTDFCAGCHRTHSAPAANLLLKAQPGLCYTCHGSVAQGAQTDAQDGAFFSTTGSRNVVNGTNAVPALRGGGFDYALVASNAYTGSLFGGATIAALTQGQATTSHHSIDNSPQTMWGNGPISLSPNSGKAGVDLTCGSCHDPHGNHQYRILKPGPTDSGIGNFSFEADYAAGGRVYINDASAKTYSTANYADIDGGNTSPNNLAPATQPATPQTGDAWNGGPQDNSTIAYNTVKENWYGNYTTAGSQWCATCHTRYNADGGAALMNSGDAVFTFRHAVYKLIVPGKVGNVPATINGQPGWLTTANGTLDPSGTSHGPKCLTCHLGHGSNAAMSTLITDQSSPGVGQVAAPHLNSSLLRLDNRGVCEACHAK